MVWLFIKSFNEHPIANSAPPCLKQTFSKHMSCSREKKAQRLEETREKGKVRGKMSPIFGYLRQVIWQNRYINYLNLQKRCTAIRLWSCFSGNQWLCYLTFRAKVSV